MFHATIAACFFADNGQRSLRHDLRIERQKKGAFLMNEKQALKGFVALHWEASERLLVFPNEEQSTDKWQHASVHELASDYENFAGLLGLTHLCSTRRSSTLCKAWK